MLDATTGSSEPDGAQTRVDASASDATPDGPTVDGGAGDGPSSDAGDCALGDAGEATELRCTGLYSDWATKTVAPDALEYDPGLHLWSDDAVKTRWIHLPAAAKWCPRRRARFRRTQAAETPETAETVETVETPATEGLNA